MNAGTILKEAKKMLCPHCYMKIKTFEKNDWSKGGQNAFLFLCMSENKKKTALFFQSLKGECLWKRISPAKMRLCYRSLGKVEPYS
jgi:hypothetical protein